MKAALLQMNVSDDPKANLPGTIAMIQHAADLGARFVLTPEVTNCVSTSRAHQIAVLQHESDDQTLRDGTNAISAYIQTRLGVKQEGNVAYIHR